MIGLRILSRDQPLIRCDIPGGVMTRLCVDDTAPDFALPRYDGNLVKLSEVLSLANVLLVFNLGFV
jgi:hypothetical protein